MEDLITFHFCLIGVLFKSTEYNEYWNIQNFHGICHILPDLSSLEEPSLWGKFSRIASKTEKHLRIFYTCIKGHESQFIGGAFTLWRCINPFNAIKTAQEKSNHLLVNLPVTLVSISKSHPKRNASLLTKNQNFRVKGTGCDIKECHMARKKNANKTQRVLNVSNKPCVKVHGYRIT